MDEAKTQQKLELGMIARDKVTGFTGLVYGICNYMYGFSDVCLMPKVDKDGKYLDGKWFNANRIEVVE